ncbi:MAG TPA: MFS transporter [Actinomycetes bacterium]|nr:MFS transporter [Actinomycetes bacterium]
MEDSRRWLMLGLGMLAQAASCVFLYGLPYLLPQVQRDLGLSLSRASVLITMPIVGLLLALVAWGAAADRYGERVVMALGLTLAGVFLFAASVVVDDVRALAAVLLLAGAGAASVSAASGRLVLGWFAPRDRGLAMGARQTAQPLGTAVAAALLPALALLGGLSLAVGACALLCAASALAVGVLARDPARPEGRQGTAGRSPYHEPFLWRLHLASACLVVPQFAVTAFSFEFLTQVRHWPTSTAATVLAVGNLAGAVVRLVVGYWSDRVGRRLAPMRTLAVAIAFVVGLVALGAASGSPVASLALVVGCAVTVATNGLAFTAVAERAGSRWAGRALGIQNTGQNLVAVATAPGLGSLIEHVGYAVAFSTAAGFSVAGAVSTPVRQERALA